MVVMVVTMVIHSDDLMVAVALAVDGKHKHVGVVVPIIRYQPASPAAAAVAPQTHPQLHANI